MVIFSDVTLILFSYTKAFIVVKCFDPYVAFLGIPFTMSAAYICACITKTSVLKLKYCINHVIMVHVAWQCGRVSFVIMFAFVL